MGLASWRTTHFLDFSSIHPFLDKWSLSSTDEAVFVGVEEPKTPAPPLQPILLILQGHLGVRFVAYASTINVTEAIFEFPSLTRDMEG